MSRQPRTGTSPELALRRELHRRGLRFRVNLPLVPAGLPRRRADIAFTRQRVAVFVDGCFWHVCPLHATAPIANGSWWGTKLARNVARDRDTDTRLVSAGWSVVRVWEHLSTAEAATEVERGIRAAVGLPLAHARATRLEPPPGAVDLSMLPGVSQPAV